MRLSKFLVALIYVYYARALPTQDRDLSDIDIKSASVRSTGRNQSPPLALSRRVGTDDTAEKVMEWDIIEPFLNAAPVLMLVSREDKKKTMKLLVVIRPSLPKKTFQEIINRGANGIIGMEYTKNMATMAENKVPGIVKPENIKNVFQPAEFVTTDTEELVATFFGRQWMTKRMGGKRSYDYLGLIVAFWKEMKADIRIMKVEDAFIGDDGHRQFLRDYWNRAFEEKKEITALTPETFGLQDGEETA